MENRWQDLVSLIQDDQQLVEAAFDGLVARYGENGRFYHNLHHIKSVLDHTQPFLDQSENRAALQFAAWFHDVIYDAQRHDNEAQSVVYARRVMTDLKLPESVICEVERLIMLTAGHKTAVSDIDGHILLDADLGILASEPIQYDAYAQAIRQEYAHVPDEAYRVGRERVLNWLGERPFLYSLPEHQNWESRAKENIQREFSALMA